VDNERLIRKIDELLEAATEADREFDSGFGMLLDMDVSKKWDGYIIGSDSPMTALSANLGWLKDELSALSLDLRTIGEPR
jgi:hypothetical protein